jgi:hypothetical protein
MGGAPDACDETREMQESDLPRGISLEIEWTG